MAGFRFNAQQDGALFTLAIGGLGLSLVDYLRLANFVAPWDARRGQPGDLRYSYGVGARLLLPFGPLRLDLAWSPSPDFDGATLGKVQQRFAYQFAIGPSF